MSCDVTPYRAVFLHWVEEIPVLYARWVFVFNLEVDQSGYTCEQDHYENLKRSTE